jgi:PAS domain S-box-containing protein
MKVPVTISLPGKLRATLAAVTTSRLTRKGLVVIAVPVLFSVAFIIGLKLLLDEAQAHADREAKSKQIIVCSNTIGSALLTAVVDSYVSKFLQPKDGREKFERDAALVESRYQELKGAVSPGTKQAELVERMGKRLRTAMSIAEDAFTSMRTTRIPGHTESRNQRGQLQSLMRGLMNDAEALAAEERKNLAANPISQSRFRMATDLLLYAGIAVDCALAVGLMAFFSASITNRLTVLMDNSVRLVEEQELNPPVPGRDEISRLDLVFHDMAEKLAQARRSERAVLERVKSIVDTIPLGVMVVSSEAEVYSLSTSSQRMFGCATAEAEGRPLAEFFDSPLVKSSGELLGELSQRSSSLAHAYEAKRQDGSQFPCEVVSTEYNTEELSGRLLVITDVTERHEIEKLKQSFVSMVSHELRSPLTSLQFCFKMLAKGHLGKLNEDGMQKVNISEKNVQRLISLVNEILDAERLESGKLTIERAPNELQEILDLAADSVNALAHSAGVKIDVEETEVELDADKNRLVQVVINLLSNAIKFSPRDSTITVSARPMDGAVRIGVTDQGRGIPSEHLDLIFKRFYQVKRTDASEKGGTGLGLAICKAIVEGHGGEIGVESAVGEGSTFWFSLPIDKEVS